MLHRDGGDPNIIFWNGPAFRPQPFLNSPVKRGGIGIAAQNLNCGGELFDPGKVSGCVGGLARAVEEFAQDGTRHTDFCFDEVFRDRFLTREKCDDNVGVEKDSTRHSARSFRSPPEWHATWHPDPPGQYTLQSG